MISSLTLKETSSFQKEEFKKTFGIFQSVSTEILFKFLAPQVENPNSLTPNGQTPLQLAIINNHRENCKNFYPKAYKLILVFLCFAK